MSAPTVAPPVLLPERVIALENVHNFRDLGGYETADGRRTRWRQVFRADALHRLSPNDLDEIRPFGLRTVIDLRTPEELDEHGRFPYEKHPLEFHHLPVIDRTWNDDPRPLDESAINFLVWAYTEMVEMGAPRFGTALQIMARPGAMPAVFHCAAGKDRTGLLAAFLLAGVGVGDDVIAEDYALTAPAMVRMMAWAQRSKPELAARMAETPSVYLAALPEAMRHILNRLRSEYGTIDGFLASIGAGRATMGAIAEQFVEG
jgi:protein-tyrosine phosphatase